MTTTIESILSDLGTTTTVSVEDSFTTTMSNTINEETTTTMMSQTEESTMNPPTTTTIATVTTSVAAATGTPATGTAQGESSNIVFKLLNKKSLVSNDIGNSEKTTTTTNLIQLSKPEATSTTVKQSVTIKETTMTTGSTSTDESTTLNLELTTMSKPTVTTENMEETNTTNVPSTTEPSTESTTFTVTTEMMTPMIYNITEPKLSRVVTTESSLAVTTPTAEILTTIDTLESFKAVKKQVTNELTLSEETTTTTAKSMEAYKEINKPITNELSFTEANTVATYEFITPVEKVTSTVGTIKPIAYEFGTTEATISSSRKTTISSSRGRMLTTTTSFPTTYAGTENDLIMATNIEEIFGMNMQPKSTTGTDVNVIIAIVVSIVGVIALLLLIGFLFLIRRRQKQTKQSQRCRPANTDAYSLDNISVFGSFRRKSASGRVSKRTYSNAAFDDPTLCHNVLNVSELAKFVEHRSHIFTEFRNIPDITAKITEVPIGCEDKNRFANIVPLPETRVSLQQQNNDEKTEYINANYVRGPNDDPKYYIATQAPLESTIVDFWRMIWEQNSRVIIQATDLVENGKEMCYEYLPQSVTLDNSNTFGDFQVILKSQDVKNQYAISTLILKNHEEKENGSRELTHYWYKWPEHGVPTEEAPLIAMLLEARASLKSYASEELNETKFKSDDLVVSKSSAKTQGPLTVHCSPGTGRTGTIIACDMAMRSLEAQKRAVDIPQLVYFIRRGRAGAVKTREQYELIYKVAKMYATKITTIPNDN